MSAVETNELAQRLRGAKGVLKREKAEREAAYPRLPPDAQEQLAEQCLLELIEEQIPNEARFF